MAVNLLLTNPKSASEHAYLVDGRNHYKIGNFSEYALRVLDLKIRQLARIIGYGATFCKARGHGGRRAEGPRTINSFVWAPAGAARWLM
eukprot:6213615-Pleurochrysis_carterae.AAC.5